MVQLILTILAISLTAATVVASLNYLPWWYRTANDTEQVLRTSLRQLERAYKADARNNGGAPAEVTADEDGGLEANFRAVLRLIPSAPTGFQWSYHQRPMDGSIWEGLHYFCLSTDGGASDGEWRGLKRLENLYSSEQYIVADSCGASAPSAVPESLPAPVSVTFYVTYIPGVDD